MFIHVFTIEYVGRTMYEGDTRWERRVTNMAILGNTTLSVSVHQQGRITQWDLDAKAAGSVTLGLLRQGSNERRFK